MEELRCHGLGMYAMWKDDAITGGSDLSTSNDKDFVGIESESFGTWFYRTTLNLFVGYMSRFVWIGYLRFLGT